jgi:catechol 2,3-dioxygenase-like lactoylglutathione lyase family enzyme
MRGMIHHLDLTVRDPAASRGFYDAVLGFMGYRCVREDARGYDWALPVPAGQHCSIGVVRAAGDGASRRHDRCSPGLHHVAFHAESRADVDRLYRRLLEIGATVLDAPAVYPQYSAGYYAVFFADPDGLKLEFVYEP